MIDFDFSDETVPMINFIPAVEFAIAAFIVLVGDLGAGISVGPLANS